MGHQWHGHQPRCRDQQTRKPKGPHQWWEKALKLRYSTPPRKRSWASFTFHCICESHLNEYPSSGYAQSLASFLHQVHDNSSPEDHNPLYVCARGRLADLAEMICYNSVEFGDPPDWRSTSDLLVGISLRTHKSAEKRQMWSLQILQMKWMVPRSSQYWDVGGLQNLQPRACGWASRNC